MSPITDKALARQEDIVVKEMPGEVLVYDLRQHKAHCLNQTATFIWNHCDGQTSVPEIAALMEQEWNTPFSEDVVWTALNELGQADLLTVHARAPETQVVLSRRRLLRRMGTGAMLLPVVLTVLSPTAAAAASCVEEDINKKCPPGTPCGTMCGKLAVGCDGTKGCDVSGNCQGFSSVKCP